MPAKERPTQADPQSSVEQDGRGPYLTNEVAADFVRRSTSYVKARRKTGTEADHVCRQIGIVVAHFRADADEVGVATMASSTRELAGA
jgi:hypothetical protein